MIMPVLIRGSSNMIVMPSTYSPATIAREFKVIHEFELSSMKYGVIFDKNVPKAAIIRMNTESFNGIPRHRIIAALDLVAKQELGENVISVQRFWQDSALFQVEGMVVEQGARGKGLATLLYEELIVKCGVILMSDNKQYEAGKALWQKIAQESDKLAVFILDSDVGQFYPYCGDRVPYNGKGIPEEKIWSLHPDTTKWGVVLVAENREKISQYC
ncbi:hypothetical protein HTP75_04565 [Yersinia pestis subsp. pestis]|uniref:hypothetical protein n=1 Tax=Yersinia pestis TaxID=632 RepID=UPI0013CB60DD|nr:hypothetical protein [Yersinia pestis]MBI0184233.1 hypothetical protein [Yersinia pestis subsp. pestis]MBI0236564.1 hypothetical protein [Yersinia pestis subsp. pestis]MCF2951699.1 hypothetical protein [Yersinia pestis subsp. pestis]MCF2959458.1 hypothetical protein [Yersinia pestis subsp. pestis]NEY09047.1 hypothetical protein [Yersinia pestis]